MTGPSGPASGEPEREEPADAPPDRLERSRSYGTAIGAAMLGLEQTLRSQPPPEVLAVEHAPARGLSGQGQDIVLVFPGESEAPGSGQGDLHADP